MTKYFLLIAFVILVASGIYYYQSRDNATPSLPKNRPSQSISANPEAPEITTLAEGLDTPWAIVFLPDNNLLVTERKGTVRRIMNEQLDPIPVATLQNVLEIGEGGLLGMALHPDFEENNFIYFYYTYQNTGDNTLNRVVRMSYQDNTLTNEEIIVDEIPGASNHNGGRIKFGPDNLLYITTGDAQEPSRAQDTNSLAGKILKVTDIGEPAPNNPFNNRIYSYGHRNPQGLAWDSEGNLWSTEHGRSGIQSGLDEVNLIQAGKNYGWPEIEGDKTRTGMETPIIHSGGNSTWAPGSIAIYNNRLFFGGLRGTALFKGTINNNKIATIDSHYEGEYGRIREAIIGPDGMLYITTSNLDGRGRPSGSDDRVIRINPEKL